VGGGRGVACRAPEGGGAAADGARGAAVRAVPGGVLSNVHNQNGYVRSDARKTGRTVTSSGDSICVGIGGLLLSLMLVRVERTSRSLNQSRILLRLLSRIREWRPEWLLHGHKQTSMRARFAFWWGHCAG
jgi:hypothetical protein